MNKSDVSFAPVGESAVLMQLSHHYLKELLTRNQFISGFTRHLLNLSPFWLVDVVPSYDTLLVNFNADKTDYRAVMSELSRLLQSYQNTENAMPIAKQHKIPVFFGKPAQNYPCDLESILVQKEMDGEEFIYKYSAMSYRVYAIGFLPNFAYAGELESELAMPRLSSPRSFVPQGAVAIADRQTAVYPKNSAGGWHILGYTPVVTQFGQNITFAVGDTISFYAISLETYEALLTQ